MTLPEFEPQPRSLEDELAHGITHILDRHEALIQETHLQNTLVKRELIMGTNERFYKVTRIVRLYEDGLKAIDMIERTKQAGERFLNRNVSDRIARYYSDPASSGELVHITTGYNGLLVMDRTPLTLLELGKWFMQLEAAEPMRYVHPSDD